MHATSSPLSVCAESPRGTNAAELKYELVFFAVLIGLLNLSLPAGQWNAAGAFHPESVLQGEWWRVLTFPFVHVSLYHLVLDAAAFFLLYSGLREKNRVVRLSYVFVSTLTSLFVSLFAAPEIFLVGLCGLSGVAHGLMAIAGIELMQRERDKQLFVAGAITLGAVVVKGVIEALMGNVLFSSAHMGNLGTPIAVCHAGGIVGALCVWLIGKLFERQHDSEQQGFEKTGE